MRGTLAHYRCEEGRVRTGDRTRQCQEDGAWSGDIPACSEYYLELSTSVNNGCRVSGFVLRNPVKKTDNYQDTLCCDGIYLGPSLSYNRSTLQSAPSSHQPSHLAVDGGENETQTRLLRIDN